MTWNEETNGRVRPTRVATIAAHFERHRDCEVGSYSGTRALSVTDGPTVRRIVLIGAAVLSSLLAWTLQPARAEDEAPTFGEVVDVRVVNLEVVVTDRGERVNGLRADDFRLLVDGREVPIDYFSEIRSGWTVPSSESHSGALPALPPDEPARTNYLVFVDDYLSIPSDRNRVLRSLEDQLVRLGPEDRMAVVAFDGRRVEMLSTWTSSERELRSALRAARMRPAHGLRQVAKQRLFDDFSLSGFGRSRFAALADPLNPSLYGATADEAFRSEELASDVGRVVDAATSALRGFSAPAGRKAMILLSGGWTASPEESAIGAYGAAYAYGSSSWGRALYAPLIDVANRVGYTLYPVDVPAVTASLTSAEHGSFYEAQLDRARSFDRERLDEETLLRLARETGGQAYLDGSRLDALAATVADTSSYYWIGFTPDWSEDDARRRVEVEWIGAPRRADIRTRQSYLDLSRSSEVTMLVESAQLFDTPLAGQDTLAVELGSAEPTGFRKVILPIRLEIPLDAVTMLPNAEGFAARLEVRVAVVDDRGARSDIPTIPFVVSGTRPPEAGELAELETRLKLRRRPHDLLVSVYDPPTGQMLSKRVALDL